MSTNRNLFIIFAPLSSGNDSPGRSSESRTLSCSALSHAARLLIVLIAAMLPAACGRHAATWKQMDVAESLMNVKPDTALAILERIPAAEIKGKETAARYALLKSMALDKNYIDTTTFDVLQAAIDYYTENGTPDEQLRTYYYQGRIYQNQGCDDAAMLSFMNARELSRKVTDSLLLAHTLVAQGALYYKEYKINEFIRNNLEAARIYGAIGKDVLEIKSYTNALDGYTVMDNRTAADSLLSLCRPLVEKNPDGESYFFPSLLSYTIEFCTPQDIKAFLDKYQDSELTTEEAMDFAHGYAKIGDYDKALTFLSGLHLPGNTIDSLKYASTKIDILEKQGKYEQAFTLYKEYSAMEEHYEKELISQDLLFSDEKHRLEMDNLMEAHDREKILWGALCCLSGLLMLAGWLYYRGRLSRTRRVLAEKENEKLKLQQDYLRKEKEKAELERDKKALEAENLEKDKQRLEAEQRRRELEADNLRLEIAQLERERDQLKELQQKPSGLAKPLRDVIKNRLNVLNSLLAKEITDNESYAKPYNQWIATVHNDKKKFMNSTRLAFTALYPKLIEYLEQHKLSTEEINYVCLYAIGLRGKEIGEYIQLKRHYNISHTIREKLNINLDEHKQNLGPYIRNLMDHLDP